MTKMRFVIALAAIFTMIGPRSLDAKFPMVKQFRAVAPERGRGLEWVDVVVDLRNQIHLVWVRQTDRWPGTYYSQGMFYRRFNSAGQPLTPVIDLTTTAYGIYGRQAMAVGPSGKIAIVGTCRDVAVDSSKCLVWFSDDSGNIDLVPRVVGADLEFYWASAIPAVEVDERGWTYIAFENYGYTDPDWEVNRYTIWLDIFDSANARVGSTRQVRSDENSYHTAENAAVAFVEPGLVAITWNASVMGGFWSQGVCAGGPEPMVRIYDRSGNAVSGELFAACDGLPSACTGSDDIFPFGPYGKFPDLAPLPDSGFAVAYHTSCLAECGNEYTVLRLFNNDGTPRTPNMKVNDVTDCFGYMPGYQVQTISTTTGDLIVLYTMNPYRNGFESWARDIYAQRYKSTGAKVGSAHRLNDVPSSAYNGATVLCDMNVNDSGLVAAAWLDRDLIAQQSWIMLQIMDVGDVGVFRCGDANNDTSISIGDAVFIINYIFAGGIPPRYLCMGDADGNGSTSIADAVTLINYIFSGGLISGTCSLD